VQLLMRQTRKTITTPTLTRVRVRTAAVVVSRCAMHQLHRPQGQALQLARRQWRLRTKLRDRVREEEGTEVATRLKGPEPIKVAVQGKGKRLARDKAVRVDGCKINPARTLLATWRLRELEDGARASVEKV